uniref:Calponin-homology (CH) domain-containing protein n=2 Tax=Caenorhabditis japonica TaxID=281687 RepID=A0A8R1EKS6_CAEJA
MSARQAPHRHDSSIRIQSKMHFCDGFKTEWQNVNVTNFSSSWADGMAFCALIHRFAPHSFDFSKLDPKNRRGNFELAFKVSEDNGIFPLLEVDDMIMMGDRPDWKCVFTYVQSFYKQFRDHP